MANTSSLHNEHIINPPTAADVHSDEVARLLCLLQDDRQLMSILQRVKDKRSSGEYRFDRYETMQLLNLCFYQVEIRPLEHNIFELLESKVEDEDRLFNLAKKISLLRQLLKEYSKPNMRDWFCMRGNKYADAALLSFYQLMAFEVTEKSTKEYDQTSSGGPWVMIDVANKASQDGLRDLLGQLLGVNPRKEPAEAKFTTWPIFKRLRGKSPLQRDEFLPSAESMQADKNLEKTRVHQVKSRKRREMADVLARFFISFTGGTLLLVPMTIMALKNDLRVSIGVIWAFVIFFIVLVSFMSRATNHEALAATAGFTAVLIIFTGSQATCNH
jgi:hypothetical protein